MEIRNIRTEDIPGTLSISLAELGSDYLSDADFIEALDSETTFCKVATDGGKVLGFSVCQVFGPESVDEFLRLPDSEERDELMRCNTIGLLDSVSILNEMKGHGIGKKLVRSCFDSFESIGMDAICAMAWKSIEGTTNIGHLLTELGLKPSLSIQGYWNQFVTSPDGHDCPVCGRPCRCYGVLYTKFKN